MLYYCLMIKRLILPVGSSCSESNSKSFSSFIGVALSSDTLLSGALSVTLGEASSSFGAPEFN